MSGLRNRMKSLSARVYKTSGVLLLAAAFVLTLLPGTAKVMPLVYAQDSCTPQPTPTPTPGGGDGGGGGDGSNCTTYTTCQTTCYWWDDSCSCGWDPYTATCCASSSPDACYTDCWDDVVCN
jgi:hypothetical protein